MATESLTSSMNNGDSPWSLNWPAPAKLNLFLHIVGRRSDGYHLLQTVFQIIDLCDYLDFRVRADGDIQRVGDGYRVDAEDDLVIRAARLLRRHAGTPMGADIRYRKAIPMGGGLGGGSSDAATTLVALNRLWGLGLSEDELAGVGLSLGADVPVFLRGRNAWAEGVGEQLTPISLPARDYLVVHPGCHVNTGAVFADRELTRDSSVKTITAFPDGGFGNDCLPVVEKHYPEVRKALIWLGSQVEAKLTGTGSCVFAAFPSAQEAHRFAAGVPEGWQAFVTRGLQQSPLLDRLSKEISAGRP